MKLFQQIQKDFAIYGIGSRQKPFNWRNLVAVLMFSIGIVLSSIHLFCEAKTFQEYADTIFTATSLVVATINFVYIACEMRRLFDSLNDAEKIINASEYQVDTINNLYSFF